MKPTVVFVRVCGKPEYEHGAKRWLSAYRKHKPKIAHELVVINRYCEPPDDSFSDFTPIRYDGGGWDCGSWQFAANNISSELLVCFNSSTYVRGDQWLERFVEAVDKNGDGLYGPLASYEIVPHIRTPCMAFPPRVMKQYPMACETREDTYRFESMGYPNGVPNVTQWTRMMGMPAMQVTWSGVYAQDQWCQPNVFRNGDQSDLIVWDRHCEAYDISDAAGKEQLERLANGR